MKLTIAIPSYNRPDKLKRLLYSIDSNNYNDIEILICEDNSPKRAEIHDIINDYCSASKYNVVYHENSTNYGYDKNLQQCIKYSNGEYIIFIGDDDVFLPGAIDSILSLTSNNSHDLGYILRCWILKHKNGTIERFKYYNSTKYFEAGSDSVYQLFRKSVFISGFTFKRSYIVDKLTDEFNGTLLFQLYILVEICMKHESVYFDKPITMLIEEDSIPYFGNSKNEESLYTPGSVTINNSVNFVKNFFVISEYVDKKYNIGLTEYLKLDMSKYSFPILAIQREKGIKEFLSYCKQLEKLGINKSFYYYIYKYALILFGKNICETIIVVIKKVIGKTPSL